MKKLILSVMFFIPSTLNAQIIFSDSFLHQLKKHLYENGDILDANSTGFNNLWIRSLLTSDRVEILNQKSNFVDVFEFHDASPHTYTHILLVVGDKYQIINMHRPYDKIIQELLNFFNQNPEIDDRLLPLFNLKIYEIFLQSTTKSQHGKWYNWWNQKDSLSVQLKIQYSDWIN